MKTAGAILLAFSLLAATAAAQDNPMAITPQPDGRTESLNVTISDSDFADVGPVWWRQPYSRIGTRYLRFHIAPPDAVGESGAILQFDAGLGQSFSYALRDIGPQGMWTGLLPGGHVVISLIADKRPEGLSLTLDRVSFEAETGTLFSTWGGKDEKVHINSPDVPEVARTVAPSVAKLVFQNAGAPRTCTGFLVDGNLLLTNEHCINNQESCDSLIALFGYEYDAENRLSFGEQFTCTAFTPARVNFELDASLVTLSGSPGTSYGTIQVPALDTTAEAPLMVIQHPGGEPKQISFIQCAAMDVPVDGRASDTDFLHTCDTAGGSSGSPVFDATGRLVGLHHYGFAEGQIEEWTENRAIRIKLVRAWMDDSESE